MNRSYYYDDLGVASIILSHGLGLREQMELLNRIYENDRELLEPEYQSNKSQFILDVLYWIDYLPDKVNLEKEFPAVKKDLQSVGQSDTEIASMSDEYDVELFFLNVRLRILYLGSQDFVRIKLRTLLARYGYKRRSSSLLKSLRKCLRAYGLKTYLRGGQECDIEEIKLDDMITIRMD